MPTITTAMLAHNPAFFPFLVSLPLAMLAATSPAMNIDTNTKTDTTVGSPPNQTPQKTDETMTPTQRLILLLDRRRTKLPRKLTRPCQQCRRQPPLLRHRDVFADPLLADTWWRCQTQQERSRTRCRSARLEHVCRKSSMLASLNPRWLGHCALSLQCDIYGLSDISQMDSSAFINTSSWDNTYHITCLMMLSIATNLRLILLICGV